MRTQSVSSLLLTLAALGCTFAASCAAAGLAPSAGAAPPSVDRLTPLSGAVGATVTIQGSGFAAENNIVKFGPGYIRNLPSSDGTTVRFTVPDGLDMCSPNPGGPCPGAYPRVSPGDYPVAVMSQGETSNNVTFTVTGP